MREFLWRWFMREFLNGAENINMRVDLHCILSSFTLFHLIFDPNTRVMNSGVYPRSAKSGKSSQ